MRYFTILPKLKIPLMAIVFFALLWSRRSAVLIHPQVWAEDGLNILNGFITQGWQSFFEPVNGYLNTIPKIISFVSLSISFLHYPLISTVLAWICIILTGFAIAYSPTHLKGKFLCAVAVFVIPTAPEVFGTSLYTFWWGGILLFLLTLWDETQKHLGWRMFFLLLAGLSSPLIVIILPLLYLRCYLYRSYRVEWTIAITATVLAASQLYFILNDTAKESSDLLSNIVQVLPVFFGKYLHPKTSLVSWFAGLAVLSLILTHLFQNRKNITPWFLGYLLLSSIAITLLRVDILIINPMEPGPRYFFYPFILISWTLIQLWYTSDSKVLRGILICIVGTTTINASSHWSRKDDDLQWKQAVLACQHHESYEIPIQTNGDARNARKLTLTGARCQELLARRFQ